MVYSGRSSGGGRYDGGGYGSTSAGGYGRRDAGARRSGSTFGAIDLPSERSLSGRSSLYSSGPSVSPWASGQSPSRHSWGSSMSSGMNSGRSGGVGPDPFSHLGAVSGGPAPHHAQSSETLNMAASLVASILQQNQQQQRHAPAPEPFGPPRPEPIYGGGDGYGGPARGQASYRGVRTSSGYGGRTEYSPRIDYGHKFDSRRDSYQQSQRGRSSFRGGRVSTRSRGGTYSSRTPVRRSDGKTDSKSATKKKPEQAKKGVKTTQQALDEAKAAALEKQMEKEGAEKPAEGAEGQDLMAKNDEAGGDTAKAAATTEATETTETAETAASADADEKKDQAATDATPAKEAEKEKKATPAKPQREKIDSKYLSCSVCGVSNVATEQGFVEHTRGRKHQTMMQMMEQRLEQSAKLIRIEVQVASKRAEIDRQRRGKTNVKDYGYCGMCNIRVYEDLNDHRSNDPLHAKLKKFLHPRCCGVRFDTPVMHERHLLSFSHFRKQMTKDKEQEAAGTGVVAVEPWPKAEPKQNGDVSTTEAEAKEGEHATTAEEQTAEGETAANAADQSMETDAAKAEEEKEEEPTPIMYDGEIAVGTKAGQPFSGTFCTICKLAMPDDSWLEHCKSRIHYNRHIIAVQRAEQAKKEAAAEAARKAAKAAKEEADAAAAAAVNAEAEEVQVMEGDPDEEAAPAEPARTEEQRGTKRAAEDDEQTGDAKIVATEVESTEKTVEDEAVADEAAEDGSKPEAAETEQPAEPAAAAPVAAPATPTTPANAANKAATPGSRGRGGRGAHRGSPRGGGFARRARGGRGGRR